LGSGIYAPVQSNTNVDITIANTLFDSNVSSSLNTTSALGLSGSAAWFNGLGSSSDVDLTFVNNIDNSTASNVNANSHAVLAISKTSTSIGIFNAEISNSIFWDNTTIGNAVTRSITDIHESSVTSVNVYNSIDENNFNDSSITSTTSTSNSDPLFISVTDFTLQASSPAVDTGDNTKIPASITTDLAGNQRILNTTVDMGAYEGSTIVIVTTTWLPTAIGSWHTASNSSNGVPTSTTNAIKPFTGYNPTIYNGASGFVNNLEIQSNFRLKVNAGSLTINGDLTIESGATLEVESYNSSNGSLILKGTQIGSGNVTYNRTVTNNWHLLASPVVGQNIAAVKNSLAFNGVQYAVAPYDNTQSLSYLRYPYFTMAAGANNIDNAGNFIAAKGYSVKKTTAGDLSF
jgi:hypothetical protein